MFLYFRKFSHVQNNISIKKNVCTIRDYILSSKNVDMRGQMIEHFKITVHNIWNWMTKKTSFL
jgi:hypothetical protein